MWFRYSIPLQETVSWQPEMSIPVIIVLALTLLYGILMAIYRIGWERQPWFIVPASYKPSTSISVVIPARNEEGNIGACIEAILNQNYPRELLEIVVVDDHSTDDTAKVIKSYSADSVNYINLAEHITEEDIVSAYKKRALGVGIGKSKGELIITTDADCISKKEWLKHVAAIYQEKKPVMIVAPVDFIYDSSLVQIFQSLDFMTLQGVTVSTFQMNMGNMCNGANLAFRKEAYYEVRGYEGIDHIASGDDYLLMMKLKNRYDNGIEYLKARQAIVATPPQPDWKSFFRQRIRWASKSGKYDDNKLTSVLAFTYLYNLSILMLLVNCFFNPENWIGLIGVLVLKTAFELFYLIPVASFYDKQKQIFMLPLLQLVHIGYIVIAGFLGFFGVYTWKGRRVK